MVSLNETPLPLENELKHLKLFFHKINKYLLWVIYQVSTSSVQEKHQQGQKFYTSS